MLKGTIKFFNAAKGFGFITPDEGDKDVFLPAPTVVSAGISELEIGQRVSFTSEVESKGPKAVSLTLIADSKPVNFTKAPISRPPRNEQKSTLTFYHDPDWDISERALAQLRAAGHEPHVVEYITSPPTKDELKRLSALLQNNGQSLVRRYDRMFLELRLDDRFISENEFWDAIVEHPALINGPVVATASRAAVCQCEDAVEDFLSDISANGGQMAAKPKGLTARALRMLAGDFATPPTANENAVATVARQSASEMSVERESAPMASPSPKKAPATRAKAPPQRKTTVKAKVLAKKAASQPAKVSARGRARKTGKKASRR